MTMLDRMRRHKNWLKWSLGLVVLTFIIFYIPDFLQNPAVTGAGVSGEVVANVEGHEVTAGEFQRRYQLQLQAFRNAYGDQLDAEQLLKRLGLDRQILQPMIDEQAALAEAERQGIRVSDAEIAQEIFVMPAFQQNGHFAGEAIYEQVLRSQRPPLTKSEFERNVRNSMMIGKLRSALTDWVSISEADAEKEYKRRNEKVKLQVVTLNANTFRDKVTVSDGDVTARYDSRKEDYRVGERRKIKYLLVDADQVRAKTVVQPAEVDRFYNDNIQQYSSPEQIRASQILMKTEGTELFSDPRDREGVVREVRGRAEAVLQKVKAGGDFAALAKQYSEDEATVNLGGDLDYFSRGRMTPEFDNAAFALEKGQISDLVQTPAGFHIIKVVDKKPATTRPIDEVRGEITEQLKIQKAQQAVADQARALDTKITTAADLDRVAKESGLQTTESGFFTLQEPIPGLGAVPPIAQEAFRLNDGETSGPITSPRGAMLLTVTGKQASYVPKLDDVKDKVRQDLILERATDLSLQRGKDLAAKLKTAKDFAAAAKAEGFESKDTELVAREAAIPDVGVSAQVDQAAFALPVNGISDPIKTPNGAVIVRVAERHDVTPDEFNNAKDAFRRDMQDERRNQFFTAYMAKAKVKMKIAVNDDVLQRVIAQF